MAKKALYTLPTTNVDGSPLDRSEILGFVIQLTDAGGLREAEDRNLEADQQETVLDDLFGVLAAGSYSAAARTIKAGLAGAEVLSDWSAPFAFTVDVVAPSPPANFSVA